MNDQIKTKPQFEYADIAELRANPRNVRVHPPRQLDRLRKSIEKFGFIAPIIVGDNSTILAGHGRLEAARMAGFRSVPIVRLAHLSTDQQAAYMLADNRLAELSKWSKESLKRELIQLNQTTASFDFQAIGFDSPLEISAPRKTKKRQGADSECEDPAAGLWILDEHKIYSGQLNAAALSTLLLGEKANLVIAETQLHSLSEDRQSSPGAFSLLPLIARNATSDALLYVCLWSWELEIALEALRPTARMLQTCAWLTHNDTQGPIHRSNHMSVAVFDKSRQRARPKLQSDVWSSDTSCQETGRIGLTTALMELLLSETTKEEEIILFPFGNSKTVASASTGSSKKLRIVESNRSRAHETIEWWEAKHQKKALFFSAKQMLQAYTSKKRSV